MNAIEFLKGQHDEIKSFFQQLEEAEQPEQKETLFREIAENLLAHAVIEEAIFYPFAYAKKTNELLTEAIAEHLAMRRIIADLLEMAATDENFDEKTRVLKEQVEHHVVVEEEMFLAVRNEFSSEQLEQTGASMEDLLEEKVEKEPSEGVPVQTDSGVPFRG